jgi:hypothetical protein
MMPRPRLKRQHGRAFYATALVLCLFAGYSLIQSVAREPLPPQQLDILTRSLQAQDKPVS